MGMCMGMGIGMGMGMSMGFGTGLAGVRSSLHATLEFVCLTRRGILNGWTS